MGDIALETIGKTIISGEITVSDLHISKTKPGFVNMDIFIPVMVEIEGQSSLQGILMLEIDPKHFIFPLIQSWPTLSQSAETLLVRRDGDDVVYLNELRHRKGTALKLKAPVDENLNLPASMAVQGREGIVEGKDYRGVEVIADTRKVKGTPWFMVAKMDKEEIFSTLKREAGLALVLMLVIIISTALGIGLLWKQRGVELLKRSHEELERRVLERTASLNKALEEIRDLYNNAPCGYHSLDENGVLIRINETELKWLGYSREELVGERKFYELLTPESLELFRKEFPLFKERGWVKDLEFEIVRKDGTILPVVVSATAIRDENGKYVMSRSTMFDITERKRVKMELENLNRSLKLRSEELVAVNRELEAFSYSVSHDLKAPLRSVDGFAKMLEEDYAGKLDDEGRRLLKVVRDSAKDMGQLISDLLDFSRLSRKEMHKTSMDMNEMVRDVYTMLEPEMKGRTVSLKVDSLPEAFGDPAMIREVVVNLLSNALKFTRTRNVSIIKIEGRVEGEQTVFTFNDNGVGFDMSYKDKLFCVFQRLHGASEFEGTGIGLALVQRIIQRHGGKVGAEGRLDGGATFSFSLPVKNI